MNVAMLAKRDRFLRQEHPVLHAFTKHHRTHKNRKATLVGYPFLRDIILDKSPAVAICKSTQCGATELLIARTIVKTSRGRNTFHVLPTYDLKNQFVQERFDKTVAFTPYYQSLMGSGEFSANLSLKHIGKGAVAFVGSNSSVGFTSFPGDDKIVDEMDECDQKNLAMADERLSACPDPTSIVVGNPTIDDFGIDHEFQKSDKKTWHVKCDACGLWFVPDFFRNVVEDAGDNVWVVIDPDFNPDPDWPGEVRLFCHSCRKPVDRFKPGCWVPEAKSLVSGYRISQLFSTNVRLSFLVRKFEEGLKNDTKLQRFYNGHLGLPFTAKGSRILFEDLDACRRDYVMTPRNERPCVLGCDVGSVLHAFVGEVTPNGPLKAAFIGELTSFEELLALWSRFNIVAGCIDAAPDLHYAKKVRDSKRNMFVVHVSKVKTDVVNADRRAVSVHRTAFLDGVREAVLSQDLALPKNAREMAPSEKKSGISEYYHMMNNSVRVLDAEKQEHNWIEGSKPDHYMFATGFALLARKLLRSAA